MSGYKKLKLSSAEVKWLMKQLREPRYDLVDIEDDLSLTNIDVDLDLIDIVDDDPALVWDTIFGCLEEFDEDEDFGWKG